MARRIIAVDVGNSQIAIGLYMGKVRSRFFRIRSDPTETADEFSLTFQQLLFAAGVKADEVEGAIVASVVPPLTETVGGCLEEMKTLRHVLHAAY